MSINVYLKKEVEQHAQFRAEKKQTKDGEVTHHYLGTVSFFYELGRPMFYLSSINHRIPEVVEPFIDEISFRDHAPLGITRESGVYQHEGAVAEVTRSLRTGQEQMFVEIHGPKLSDIKKLWDDIKAGTIRPEVSYEGPQGGESRAELLSKIAHLEVQVYRLENAVEQQTSKVMDRVWEIQSLEGKIQSLKGGAALIRQVLERRLFPWVCRSKVLHLLEWQFPKEPGKSSSDQPQAPQ